MRVKSPGEVALQFHETLLEVLKRLNQAEQERPPPVEGLELLEIERMMELFTSRHPGQEDGPERAVSLLLENGLIRQREDPEYAWDRRRTLGTRYTITALGKSYLVRQLAETERIR
jgi:hypothetical protein